MWEEIGQVKQQQESMQRMLEDMGRMQAALLQKFTAFTAYGMHPPSANPSLTHVGQAFPIVRLSYLATGPFFQHAMLMQLPVDPAFPMGQIGGQLEAPDTSSVNPRQMIMVTSRDLI
ncbi:hypothetical protein SLA2020_152040 [Shorea laevis]